MAIYKDLVKKVSIPAEKKTKQKDYKKTGAIPIVDQGKDQIGGYADDCSKEIICDLPVIVFGDHTCAVKYIDYNFCPGADGIKVLSPKDNIYPKYLFYGTQYLVLKLTDRGYSRHYQYIEKMDFPVVDWEKQEDIVSKIEELFSRLDKGVETLKKIKEQLNNYRLSAINDGFKLAGNNTVKLGELIERPKYGTSKKCDYVYEKNSTAVFRIPNIDYKNGRIDSSDIKYATFTEEELSSIDLKENDVLIIRSNGSVSLVGRTAIVRKEDTDKTFAGYLIRLRAFYPSFSFAKYLHYYLESLDGRIYIENVAKSTSGVNNVNADEIKNINIPVCDEATQYAIVREIDSKISVCDSIEKTVDEALLQAEAMRQSILKKAFEGELI